MRPFSSFQIVGHRWLEDVCEPSSNTLTGDSEVLALLNDKFLHVMTFTMMLRDRTMVLSCSWLLLS